MKLSKNIIPLMNIATSFFIISYHNQHQHGGRTNLGRATNASVSVLAEGTEMCGNNIPEICNFGSDHIFEEYETVR